nr:helix-turn-helix transcriptional regulator [uncultured Bacteroides sp.]
MKKEVTTLKAINSISELHRLLALPKPEHPLISVISFDDIKDFKGNASQRIKYNFYQICIKKDVEGKLRYGQNYYDFDEGIITFISPGQIISSETVSARGWLLIIHPDFLQGYPLAKAIKQYGFFSYELSEALFLSEKEEREIEAIMKNIEQEYQSLTDAHTQDIIVSQIELLLNYSNRFYNRQFITRKKANNDLLTRLESILSDYFNTGQAEEYGLPTVDYLAKKLHVSSHYLSDMLRTVTGENTQQHIQNKLIEKAKETLSTTSLSVSEIAYQLGFKYPQSFNKLFKNKTNLTPLEFRTSFNTPVH